MRTLPRPSASTLLVALAFSLIGYFLFTVVSTYAAVVRVEATYQIRKLTNAVGVGSVRELLIPNFSTADWHTDERTREFGISIPDIYLSEPVIFNVDPSDKTAYQAALQQGIAHAAGTGFPGSGELGYYFAHSSSQELYSQYNAVFYLLGKLQAGNQVSIWHEGEKFQYTVQRTAITTPSDVSFLEERYDAETIVLQTCWPPGTTLNRLLVFAERNQE